MPDVRYPTAVVIGLVVALAVAGCSGDDSDSDSTSAKAVKVNATDTTCEVSETVLSAGKQTFSATNAGGQAMELYVYAPGDQVVSELHNVDPGDTEDLTVQLDPGNYQLACKPGKKGSGIRQQIVIRGSGTTAATDPRLDGAVADYHRFVEQQIELTIPRAESFADAVKSGDVARAKQLYPLSRVGWERIEPVAESFGDIDPKVDLREADLEAGQKWTGWHQIEKALWAKGSTAGEASYADQLIADLKDLQNRVTNANITPTSMANGAKELLDEVATSKITGEEETWSHTDLYDFAANVDGARQVYLLLREVVAEKDAALAKTLDQQFATVTNALKPYQRGDGYLSYDQVNAAGRKKLSDAVNALGEPLSKLAAAVAG